MDERLKGVISANMIIIGIANFANIPIANTPLTQLNVHQIIAMATILIDVVFGVWLLTMED